VLAGRYGFTLEVGPQAVQLGNERWKRLLLFATILPEPSGPGNFRGIECRATKEPGLAFHSTISDTCAVGDVCLDVRRQAHLDFTRLAGDRGRIAFF